MSSSGSDPPTPNTVSWALWQGLETIFGTRNALVNFSAQPAPHSVSSSITEPERIQRALTFPYPQQRQCMVPGCRTINCNLGTHRKYNPRSINQPWSSTRSRIHDKLDRNSLQALHLLQLYPQERISNAGVDGFPKLPIEETLDPTARSLFHFFFVISFDHLAMLFRGPSVSNMDDLKSRMMSAALNSEPYCRALMLQARNEQDLRQVRCEETQEALGLYNNTVRAFREQLEYVRTNLHPLQIELGLLVLCILLAYDLVHHHNETLHVHWHGLRDLVALRGGIHQVTMSLAYVIHVDRECAVQAGTVPTYINPAGMSLPMPSTTSGLLRYGARFSAVKLHSSRVDPRICDYLIDVSSLVGLWEESRINQSNIDRPGTRASPTHLYYLRDRMDERFAVLHAQWGQVDTLERCLIWAARIVEYPCTWSNYIRTTNLGMCEKLVLCLQNQSHFTEWWKEDLDELIWILFTLAAVEPSLEPHSGVVNSLREVLKLKYGCHQLPNQWWLREQASLSNFMWSDSLYTHAFLGVCREIEMPLNVE